MFLVNSRLGLFSATPFSSTRKVLHLQEAHLLPKLRWQFAEFLSWSYLKRLGILSLPTCVGLRYGQLICSIEGFPGSMASIASSALTDSYSDLRIISTDLPILTPYFLEPGIPSPGQPSLLRHLVCQTHIRWCRIVDLLPIGYAFRPHLRGRLTHRGLSCRWKP